MSPIIFLINSNRYLHSVHCDCTLSCRNHVALINMWKQETQKSLGFQRNWLRVALTFRWNGLLWWWLLAVTGGLDLASQKCVVLKNFEQVMQLDRQQSLKKFVEETDVLVPLLTRKGIWKFWLASFIFPGFVSYRKTNNSVPSNKSPLKVLRMKKGPLP